MIEAVNSTIASAALVRNVAEQVAVARAQSPTPAEERREISVPLAPYISPYIKVDTEFDTAVLLIRDSNTGDVIDQFPRETTLAARQRQEVLREISARQAEVQAQASSSASSIEFVDKQDYEPQQQAAPAPKVVNNTAFIAQQQSSASSATVASTSNVQLATVAFSVGAKSGAPTSSQSVSVTA